MSMHRLNYHHLLYFHTVAREGSIARASSLLGLKQPTVSAQIHELEKKLNCQLFERSGRGLRITAAGNTVLRYAESIFALGGEMLATLDGQPAESARLNVGVGASLSPALVSPLLSPLLALNPMPVLTITEAASDTLAAQLSSQSLHFVLDDLAAPSTSALRSRVLLESPIAVFAPAAVAPTLRKSFPRPLAAVPVLMPSSHSVVREVEHWLASHKQSVQKLAELPHPENFAASARAAIFAPSLLRDSLKKSHALLPVAELEGTRWRLFSIADAKLARHPGLAAITRAARALR